MTHVSRREFVKAGLVAGALGHLPGLARAAGAPGVDGFFSWTEVRPGVFAAVDLSMGGNVLVAGGADESVLVDTKFPAFAAALAREGAARSSKITHVVNTHHHADHTGGNGVLKGAARIFAHRNAVSRIEAQIDRYKGAAAGGVRQIDTSREGADAVLEEAAQAAGAGAEWSAADFAPDVPLDGERNGFAVGGTEFALHHFGAAHTDNDLIVQLPDSNVIHTGDVCFHGLHPFFDPSAGVTCSGWIGVVGRIIDLCDDDTVVVPGHGEVGDKAILTKQRDYLEAILENVRKAHASGKSKEETAAMSWDFMDGLGFEQIRSRAIGAVYDEVAKE